MMKYIRTETNLFEVVSENALVYKVKGKRDSEKIYSISKRYGKIIGQADTIEELCDEFIEVGNHKPFLAEVRFKHWDKQTKNILNKQGTEVYGAIWTDKGLIYVAKMNDKGELELL